MRPRRGNYCSLPRLLNCVRTVPDREPEDQERSIACGDRVTFSLRGQEKSDQKRRPPRLALARHRATAPALPQLVHPCTRHARQVREAGPGFSTAHPCAGEKESTSLSTSAARPVVPDSPAEQRAIPARTFQKSRSRAEQSRSGLIARSDRLESLLR